jgi:hypothetical protein
VRLLETRLQRRVDATRRAGRPLPRLEQIAVRFGLEAFDRNVVVLLIGKTVSPVVKTLTEALDQSRQVDESTSVGQVRYSRVVG